MEEKYSESIRPILDVFDKIRENLRNEPIELPKIVVVGDQSAGKSSVLESITGIALPRGQNTVTKCPIIIQSRMPKDNHEFATIRTEGSEETSEEIPLAQLSDAIATAQANLLKKENLEISSSAIYITLFKENSPELTLYDLPGITYKNEALTQNIRKIIKKYTQGSLTQILLVIPANVDLTTSEAISLIRENADYTNRTLAVITKLDLGITEKGFYSKIINNELGLKCEPILVRNRTQEELENNEPIEKIRAKEMQLINTSNELNKLPESSKGTDKLIDQLIEMQREMLLTCRYDLKDQLIVRLTDLKTKLSALPEPIETLSDKVGVFKSCLNKFESTYIKLYNGNSIDKKMNFPTRIKEKFDKFNMDTFNKVHSKLLNQAFHDKIAGLVKESRGLKLPDFFDSDAFKSIIFEELEINLRDIYKLLDDVTRYISEEILGKLCDECFNRYPNLKKAVSQEIRCTMLKQSDLTIALTNNLLEIERNNIFTINTYYLDTVNKIKEKVEEFRTPEGKQSSFGFGNRIPNTTMTSQDALKEKFKINDIEIDKHYFDITQLTSNSESDKAVSNMQLSIFAYWKVFEKRFADYYLLTIMHNNVNYFRDHFKIILDTKYSPTSNKECNSWISESKEITIKRKQFKKSLIAVEDSLSELEGIL